MKTIANADTNSSSIRNVNYEGKTLGGRGSPKSTDGGMDLSKNAKNVIGKISKTKENSPSASSMACGHKKSY